MRFNAKILSSISLLTFFSIIMPTAVKAEIQACTHGTALLQSDAQAWLSMQNQMARFKKNVTKIRTEITDIIDMNDDVKEADKTAKDIHTKLSLISPLFELAPSLQSGLDKTAKAADVSHKNVLGPIYKVTDAIVTKARLHEIRAEIDKKVLPNISKFEADASKVHLKSVTLGKDYIEACHIAATIKSVACISSGNKAIEAVYNDFNKPLRLADTAVLDAAKALGVVNKVMETELAVTLTPVIDIHAPIVDISKVVRELEKEIHKLERAMKKHIHIHIGALKFKFMIEQLLKDWKLEVKKLEHLVDVDKLKKEMRKEIDKILHPIVEDIEKFIKKFEHSFEPKGIDLAKLEAELKALEKMLAFNGPSIDLSPIEKAIKDMEDALRALEACK